MWFFKNGEMFVLIDVVIGDLVRGFVILLGIYFFNYKVRNVLLIG